MKGGERMTENSFPMSVHATDIDDELLSKINKHTRRTFNANELFAFEGVISDDSLDTFDTRMDPETTLRNYAADLLSGVSMIDWHDTNREPYARSFDSSIYQDGELTKVSGSFYMLRDSNSNGRSTNDIIRNIEGGITRDLSVGFSAGIEDYICSVDGKSMMMSPYFPGDRTEEGQKVFYWIKNAHLREVSTVYKGSNHNAYIQKARQMVDDGLMDENRIAVLQEGLGTRFDELDKPFFDALKRQKTKGVKQVDIKEIRSAITVGKLAVTDLRKVMEDHEIRFESQEDVAIRNALGEGNASVEAINRMKQEAEAGRKYKEDLIDSAVKARVAVQGEDFNAESYKSMLTRADLEFIKEERESYEKMKSKKFSSGRQIGSEEKDDEVMVLR
jgi:hypothetical protein